VEVERRSGVVSRRNHLHRLADPAGLFNASLDGNVRRAIDLHEGDDFDEDAFRTLIRAAVALNRSSAR
jgi:hypothetical protein